MQLRRLPLLATRFSLLAFTFPDRYLDTTYAWGNFDIHEWSDQGYTWTQDPWNGWFDFVQRPRETLQRGRGDCDDYALVAASWARSTDRDGLGLAVCGTGPRILHMIAFDEDRTYSSGEITREGPGAFLDRSEYTWIYTREL